MTDTAKRVPSSPETAVATEWPQWVVSYWLHSHYADCSEDESREKLLKALDDAGFVIVPKEPTNAMICAALEASLDIMAETGVNALSPFKDYPPPGEVTKRCYRAMVAKSKGAMP
jgi:hypothetical protein